jgi:hypothetical protein
MKLLIFIFCLSPFAAISQTYTDYNRTLTSLGTQNGTGYIRVSPPTSIACLYDVIYIGELNSISAKSNYVIALAAYSSDKITKRIDFIKNNDSTCKLILIEF